MISQQHRFITSLILVLGFSLSLPLPLRPAGSGVRCHRPWLPPVEAPVVDPFRPPSHLYGPGNRGLAYGTEPGQEVSAVADGVVRFAAPVGGRPVVVVDHGAHLWSTYTGLEVGLVQRGQSVRSGQVVARSDSDLHLTARRSGRYLDPASLLERRCRIVRLVVPPGS